MSAALFLVTFAVLVGPAEIPLPGTSSVTVGLAPPTACVECHGTFDPKSAYETWVGSVMGHSARDPVFLAALTEANRDLPGSGDFCLRCHATEAWLRGACVEPDGRLLTDEDSGVTCSVCHRMDPSPWVKNGQFLLGNDLDYRGPYADAVAPHHVQRTDFISSSELCGTCHDLVNPLVERKDLDGNPMGMLFAEQTTYTEWKTSEFARGPNPATCQNCHMPEDEGRIAPEGPVRKDRSSHEMSGGNVFLLNAIAFLEPGLGISERLAQGAGRSEAMLRTAATLEAIAVPTSVRRGETLELRLRITNETGHKLPTGYPEGRRIWLQLESEELGLSRGAFDETTGEPIDPVAIYHVKQGQAATGTPGIHLILNDTVFYDSRIPPRGMIVTATTAPVGKTYPEVSAGVLAHYDELAVQITVPCDPGLSAIPLSATLWYQAVTKAYVDALVAANEGNERGARLSAAFEEADPGPIEMEELALELVIDPESSCDPLDAGAADLGVSEDAAVADASDAGVHDTSVTVNPVPIDEGCACRQTHTSSRGSLDGGAIALLLIGACVAWSRSRRSSR
jgi:hypothetical protein